MDLVHPSQVTSGRSVLPAPAPPVPLRSDGRSVLGLKPCLGSLPTETWLRWLGVCGWHDDLMVLM